MTSNPRDGRVPAACAAGVCKGPGCGNALPAQDRGRARQFCSTECARRYHNDARVLAPAGPVAGSPADPLAELDAVIRRAAVLARAARDQAASLDPALVRAQLAEAATVTAEAPRRRSRSRGPGPGRGPAGAREDARAAQVGDAAARQQAQAAAAALEEARRDAAGQIAAARDQPASQVAAAQADAASFLRET
jgi:hypothetical protein